MRETHIHLTKARQNGFNESASGRHSVTTNLQRGRLLAVLLLILVAIPLVVAIRMSSTVEASGGNSSGNPNGKRDGKAESDSAGRQSASGAQQLRALGQLPLQFEKNKGQAVS